MALMILFVNILLLLSIERCANNKLRYSVYALLRDLSTSAKAYNFGFDRANTSALIAGSLMAIKPRQGLMVGLALLQLKAIRQKRSIYNLMYKLIHVYQYQ